MTKLFTSIVLVSMVLLSCNETKKEETKKAIEKIEVEKTAIHPEKESINNLWIQDINLNNGEKWQANIETTQGVNAMLKTISESDLKTVDNYLNLAMQLNSQKNTLVQKCTMQGVSHDNLHVFLHPLIQKINHLKKTKTTESGAKTVASIVENLDAYTNYFK